MAWSRSWPKYVRPPLPPTTLPSLFHLSSFFFWLWVLLLFYMLSHHLLQGALKVLLVRTLVKSWARSWNCPFFFLFFSFLPFSLSHFSFTTPGTYRSSCGPRSNPNCSCDPSHCRDSLGSLTCYTTVPPPWLAFLLQQSSHPSLSAYICYLFLFSNYD